jgi:transposase InsO family protein
MAAESRSTSQATVIHSDHGTQFTSWAFTENIRRFGLKGSMGTIGDCYDNAPMESFWGSMQIELLNRQSWKTVIELSAAMADYIETFYNPSRRHSSLAYLTPDEFEDLHLRPNPYKRGPPNGVKARIESTRLHVLAERLSDGF